MTVKTLQMALCPPISLFLSQSATHTLIKGCWRKCFSLFSPNSNFHKIFTKQTRSNEENSQSFTLKPCFVCTSCPPSSLPKPHPHSFIASNSPTTVFLRDHDSDLHKNTSLRASYSVENLVQDDYCWVLDICVLNNSCINKQGKPSTGLGHSKPSSPTAPSCKQQPQAKRTPLFRVSTDIPHIPPPPAPPRLLPQSRHHHRPFPPNHTRPISRPKQHRTNNSHSTLCPTGRVLSSRPSDLRERKGTLKSSFYSPKGVC